MIQLHGSLEPPQTQHNVIHVSKQVVNAGGYRQTTTEGNETDDMENIPAEECRENKVIYRINTTIR